MMIICYGLGFVSKSIKKSSRATHAIVESPSMLRSEATPTPRVAKAAATASPGNDLKVTSWFLLVIFLCVQAALSQLRGHSQTSGTVPITGLQILTMEIVFLPLENEGGGSPSSCQARESEIICREKPTGAS